MTTKPGNSTINIRIGAKRKEALDKICIEQDLSLTELLKRLVDHLIQQESK
jgi:antitoxin component of RelBE/YafQ-DinJ toxin-antitoxin module